MAKSTRSKVKRAHRSKKRQEGVYAATEAARLERLSARLSAVISIPEQLIGDGDSAQDTTTTVDGLDNMTIDSQSVPEPTAKRISTHGPRNSRRAQWRASKGLDSRPKPRGMNRQGTVAAHRRAGRSHRRR